MSIRSPQIFGNTWFNTTHPITPEEMNGRVVLVDFFTYSCVNCLRTLPHLKKIWNRYKRLPFFIIGVHTPEFEFEKNSQNVRTILSKLGVTWPVVLDNDRINWDNFANHYWPAEYLLDQNGYIVYENFGEGNYAATEQAIQATLKKDFGDTDLPPIESDMSGDGNFCIRPTPELYCGYIRGRLANHGGYHEGHLGSYKLPEHFPMDMIVLSGQWNAMPEYIESFSNLSAIAVNFAGTEVNMVAESVVDQLAVVSLSFNGDPIESDIAGDDVDQSDVVISTPRLYNLIKSDKPLEGILKIVAKESNFKAYSFTFSGCARVQN